MKTLVERERGFSPTMQRRLFTRSLLLQACWSFERMQSLGLAYSLKPWLGEVWRLEPEAEREALLRHNEFFAISHRIGRHGRPMVRGDENLGVYIAPFGAVPT